MTGEAASPVGLTHTRPSAHSLPLVFSSSTDQPAPTMRVTAADGTQYTTQQMHFHWGGASLEISGSEHTIDGIRYVIEVP